MRLLGVVAVAAALTVAGLGAGTAQAESAPGCSSTVQIGSTAYAKYQGEISASVKQFKGCGKNWAYIYVWDQFRAKHLDYYLISFIAIGDDAFGYKESATGARELWSSGTDTLAACTRADGAIFGRDADYGYAETDQRC
ncbi:hypothetical protein [Kutzneria sp. NPDC051319]|uniref:hypothetical protein n=1 Tax=Kutzneria sp. NPDC051319 TaxID=3155047 RepID=UPI0034378716